MGLQRFKRIDFAHYDEILDSTEEFISLQRTKKIIQSAPRGVALNKNLNGGHKRLYRKIDYWRKKVGWTGHVEIILYDPNRNARLALVHYENGKKDYILAPEGLQIGKTIIAGFRVPLEIGNALPLWNIPLGTSVHNVTFRNNSKGRIARAAGTSVQLISRERGFAILRFPSNRIRLVKQTCWATVGQVGNITAKNGKIGKAGRSRWLGVRPQVRGSVKNPVDHPHGGGEGRCPIGRSNARTPWGKPRLGMKTRRRLKYSNTFILR